MMIFGLSAVGCPLLAAGCWLQAVGCQTITLSARQQVGYQKPTPAPPKRGIYVPKRKAKNQKPIK